MLTICLSTVKPPPNPNFAQQPMASILKAGLPSATRPPALPPIRYAAAAAAAVASTPTTQGPSSHTSSQQSQTVPLSVSNPPPLTPIGQAVAQSTSQESVVSSPSLTHPSVTSPMLSSASVSHRPDGSFHSDQESPALSEPVPSAIGGPAAMSSPQRVAPRKGARHENSMKAFIHLPIVVDSVSSQRPGMASPSASVSSFTIVWTLLSCHSI